MWLARVLSSFAFAVLLWAVADAGSAPASPSRAAAAGAELAGPAPTVTEARRHRRPGCGTFCRQAGGFGAGPDSGPGPVFMPKQSVRVDAYGEIAIRARCIRDAKCVGAILVDGHVSYGRADLRIPGHTTRFVRVVVPARALRYLDTHPRDPTAFATVPTTDFKLSISYALTILAPL